MDSGQPSLILSFTKHSFSIYFDFILRAKVILIFTKVENPGRGKIVLSKMPRFKNPKPLQHSFVKFDSEVSNKNAGEFMQIKNYKLILSEIFL